MATTTMVTGDDDGDDGDGAMGNKDDSDGSTGDANTEYKTEKIVY